MADNKVKFGLENVYVAFHTDNGFDTPIHIPGAVNLTTDPAGNQNIFYADDIPYVTFNTDSGYTGTLEMALIPDSVKASMFGWDVDDNGALVEVSGGMPKAFALLYEIKGDAKNRRNVFYSVTAARPSGSAATQTDSTDPDTETLDITMIPKSMTVGGVSKNVTKASMEKSAGNATAYNGFFTTVYTPVETGTTGA